MERPIARVLGRPSVGGQVRLAGDVWSAFTAWERTLLVGGSLVCLLAARALAALAAVPADPGFGGSVLQGGVVSLAVALAVVAVGLAAGSVVAGSMGVEGAVFCAAIGLAALAVRCGPMRPVLQYAAGRGVWLTMAGEVLILAAALVGGWALLTRVVGAARRRNGAEEVLTVPHEVADATVTQRLAATGVAALVTAAVELLLVQTDRSAQCLGGVAVASFLGALAGYSYLPLAVGVWYWVAPVLTAVAGYVAAYAIGDGGNGDVHGYLAALGRPTPLHVASAGVAAAVLGHWSSRRWAVDQEVPIVPDAQPPVP